MKLFLATSCLQTRPMKETIYELMELQPDGLQLTAGNVIPENFKEWFLSQNIPYMIHHNFSWKLYRQRPWSSDGRCLVLESNSIHPPLRKEMEESVWHSVLDNHKSNNLPALEFMYDDYYLNNNEELNLVMNKNIPVAIDISHINIMFHKRLISEDTWNRVMNYENIKEIHVSQNNGRQDTHKSLLPDSFGLDWAKERSQDGTPVVLECYMHRLSDSERQCQIELLRK